MPSRPYILIPGLAPAARRRRERAATWQLVLALVLAVGVVVEWRTSRESSQAITAIGTAGD